MDKAEEAQLKLDALRRHVASLVEDNAKATKKLMKKLADQEHEFISSFDGEWFLELQSIRQMAGHLTRILALFDAGEITFSKDGPTVTDPQELLDHVLKEQKKKIFSGSHRTSFSSSPAANQMERYDLAHAAKVVELLDW